MYQYHDSTKDLLISSRESVYKYSKANKEFHILCVTLYKSSSHQYNLISYSSSPDEIEFDDDILKQNIKIIAD